MSESSPYTLIQRRRVLLDQASAALRGQVVALWRLASGGRSVAEVVSQPDPPRDVTEFDLAGLLRRWGRAAGPESLWVACRVDVGRWHVAPVRCDSPMPPPSGVERRSPERLVVELAGLCLGALERIRTTADQATVYLCAALDFLETALGQVRQAHGLSTAERAVLLANLAGVADAIEGALTA